MKDRSSFDIFTCRYYTELVSKSIDSGLSLKERLFFSLHHIICTFCRRSRRQILVIDRVIKHRLRGNAGTENDQLEQCPQHCLSEAAKKRIAETFTKKL